MSSIFLFDHDEATNNKLNIDELYERRQKRDLKQLSIFNKILNRIHVRIKTTSKQKHDSQFCWYVVPEIMIGVPKYDQGACIAYLLDKLTTNGFNVRYIDPNTLFISWLHWVPSYVRTELKKKTGIVIDEYGKKIEENEVDAEDIITEEDLEEDAAIEPRKIDMRLEDLRKDIESVFAADTNLSEEFKTQAGAIFEAAVIARVNHEVEAISAELTEQNVSDFEELKEGLVEKVDSYLNYVVEQWMKDNEVAVEQGLRTEVAEDFMLGLKNLFQEHYFEVPEDKVDVLADMSSKVDEVTARLNDTVAENIQIKTELDGIKRDRIIEQACRDLTATDAEKMSKLLEGVEFGNEELFSSKVKVVKENYFPGNAPVSPEKTLEESVQTAGEGVKTSEVPANMKQYTEALSRIAKVKAFK